MNSAVLQSLAFPWSHRTTTTAPFWTIPRPTICINLTLLTHFKLLFIILTQQLKISTRTSHIFSSSRSAGNLISLRIHNIPTRLEGHFETMLFFALFFSSLQPRKTTINKNRRLIVHSFQKNLSKSQALPFLYSLFKCVALQKHCIPPLCFASYFVLNLQKKFSIFS